MAQNRPWACLTAHQGHRKQSTRLDGRRNKRIMPILIPFALGLSCYYQRLCGSIATATRCCTANLIVCSWPVPHHADQHGQTHSCQTLDVGPLDVIVAPWLEVDSPRAKVNVPDYCRSASSSIIRSRSA
ncbi:hypothetical protein BDV23DRAFT_17081 [Aspergillus alliaceus]|uniref:Uncharacterized protein n=1 Tax=Petromyces alliaceus TaxID=209559 RepID=A0A5N7CJT7_PETAA|nr:hypothetical protein BDV23DRAFT_17081 [Aspergillus alliaceus]